MADHATVYVRTSDIKDAVRGREEEVLGALGIRVTEGSQHIDCPYPEHGGRDDWRWDQKKAKAFCTCTKADSIFDVVRKCEDLSDFEETKIRVAGLIGREDLIRQKANQFNQASDAASLLSPPAENRDDSLVAAYLAHRLECERGQVPMPATPVAGIKAMGYFDPPPKGGGRPSKVGEFPCAVFGTVDRDGRRHALRIYLAPGGAGKAGLGRTANGHDRDPKKSAKVAEGDNTAGRSVIWGDPEVAEWVILAEGIETAAGVALAFRPEIEAGTCAVAAAINAGGVEAFLPWPSTKRITVAADRDEKAKPGRPAPTRRGEEAARKFGLRHHDKGIDVAVALPGEPGDATDWLDVHLASGPEAVRTGILAGKPFVPTTGELEGEASRRQLVAELEQISREYPLPAMENMRLEYRRTKTGKVRVHRISIDKKGRLYVTPVATPFGISARLRLLDWADAYGVRIVVQDMGGTRREVDMERGELARMAAAEARSLLFSAGLRTEADGEMIAVACLKAADPETEITVVSKSGWHWLQDQTAPIFVCPDGRIFGAPAGCAIELSLAARISPAIAKGGSLEGWKEAVETAVSVPGCQHWALGVICGFAGALVSLTGLDTCGINLSGMTTSGKTTAQRLAVSAWSKAVSTHEDSLLKVARASVNSSEVVATRATGTVFAADELAHVSGKELGKLIYMLAGGVGRSRMKADATLRKSYAWSTFVILSAECSLEEKITGDGGEWAGGMAVRMPDIDVTAVNRRVAPEILSKIEAVQEHFGYAGPAFVEGLIAEGLHIRPSELRDGIKDLARRLSGPKGDGALQRAAIPFAILSMAGTLAQRFGLLPETLDVPNVVQWAWTRFQASTDAEALDPEQLAITKLQTWISERWGSSIQPIHPPEVPFAGERIPPRDAVGWYDDEAVYLPAERLREAAGGTLKEIEIAKALLARDLLAKRQASDRYFVSYVPKIGRVKAYALSRKGFGRTGLEHDPDALRVVSGGRS